MNTKRHKFFGLRWLDTALDVAFNPARVSSGTALLGTSFSNHVIRSREVAPGVRRVLVYSRNNSSVTLTNGGIVAAMPLTVSSQERVSSGPLPPGSAIVARPDATAVAPVNLSSGTIFVRPVNLLPEGHVQFFLPSQPDERYLIQATTNFVNWVNLSTNLATGDFMDLLDLEAALYPYRFFMSPVNAFLQGIIVCLSTAIVGCEAGPRVNS